MWNLLSKGIENFINQEEEETDKTKQAQIEQTYEKHRLALFPKRGNRNAKMTGKHKNTQDKKR